MVDSTAKSGHDLLRGSQYQLGSFDECLQTAATGAPPPPVLPQYCLAEVRVSAATPATPGRDNATAASPATPASHQAAPTPDRLPTSDEAKADAFQPLWPRRNQVSGRAEARGPSALPPMLERNWNAAGTDRGPGR